MIGLFNNKRGCGDVKEGGFYLTSASPDLMGFGGSLNKVTMWYGCGRESFADGGVIFGDGKIPARGMVQIDPAATLVHKAPIFHDYSLLNNCEMYAGYKKRVTDNALADHVGSNNYTAWGFIQELQELGPNRRVPMSLIKKIAPQLPMPVVFWHSDVPIFESLIEMVEVAQMCSGILEGKDITHLPTAAVWNRDDWGMFARQDTGQDHMMQVILAGLDKYRTGKDALWAWLGKDQFDRLDRMFKSLTYVEQPICSSWFLAAVKIVGDGAAVTAADRAAGIQPANLKYTAEKQGEI